MCCVIVIAGKTGVGKSTITEYINKTYGFCTLSFAAMGKDFATRHGRNRLRDCYREMNRDDFVSNLVCDMKEIVLKTTRTHNVIVIDGLYSYFIIQELKKHNRVVVIYINADDDVRFLRISNRLQTDNSKAREENDIKEEIKSALGNDKILGISDYIIDGNRCLDEVLSNVCNALSEVV